MNKVEPIIEKGAGIAFRLHGYSGEFKIALFKSEHFGGSIDTGFYNEEEKVGFIGSLYSGGETGFGRHAYEILNMKQIKERGYELITSDFSKVRSYMEDKERKRIEREQKRKEKIEKKIAEIEKMPKEFLLYDENDVKIVLKRRDPSVRFGRVVTPHHEEINGRRNHLSDYISTDGKILKHAFVKYNRDFLGDKTEMVAKDLKIIIDKYKEVLEKMR